MQFGRTLHRILQKIIKANPRFGPVYLCKIDLADGFYRIWLLDRDIPKMAVTLPMHNKHILAFPLVLPMGWKNSPPFFCAATETITDMTNAALCKYKWFAQHRHDQPSEQQTSSLNNPQDASNNNNKVQLAHDVVQPNNISSPHQQDATQHDNTTVMTYTLSNTTPTNWSNTTPIQQPIDLPTTPQRPILQPLPYPIRYTDVYVDDFIQLAQGNAAQRRHVKRALFHALDQVFRALDPTDNPHRQEPASQKKFSKGEAAWSTRAVILGWIVDTVKGTIELPPHRLQRLHDILENLPRTRKHIKSKSWQRYLGELRSMATAIPGARGLFSTLQEALTHPLAKHIRLRRSVHDFLEDFRYLASELSLRPTRIAELVPQQPLCTGACDASGAGMGGVHFIQTPNGIIPTLWRAKFATNVTRDLVSFTNPQGTITNSDLELAASVVHADVLSQEADIREATTHNAYDNTPTVYWQRKGSTTTSAPAAYLLRLQSLHQRFHRYVPTHDYVQGQCNVMPDFCSRAWHLSDTALLSYFNLHFPQTQSWQLCHPRKEMLSAVHSALYRKRSPPALFLHVPQQRQDIGPDGNTFAPSTSYTHTSTAFQTRSQYSRFGPRVTDQVRSHPVTSASGLAPWRTPYVRWVRASPSWASRTRVRQSPVTSTSA